MESERLGLVHGDTLGFAFVFLGGGFGGVGWATERGHAGP